MITYYVNDNGNVIRNESGYFFELALMPGNSISSLKGGTEKRKKSSYKNEDRKLISFKHPIRRLKCLFEFHAL